MHSFTNSIASSSFSSGNSKINSSCICSKGLSHGLSGSPRSILTRYVSGYSLNFSVTFTLRFQVSSFGYPALRFFIISSHFLRVLLSSALNLRLLRSPLAKRPKNTPKLHAFAIVLRSL